MPPQNQGRKQSFIPRKTTEKKARARRGGLGAYFTVALILFTVAAAASAGVFFYERFLIQRIDSMAVSLERAQAAFEPSLIRELKRVSARMDAANELLDGHTALSVLFRYLGEKTLKTVQFSRFSYALESGTPVISMSGVGRGYSSVALQSDVFGEDQFIKNPVFSNLGLDREGNVTFDVRAAIDPSLVLYAEIVE